MNLRELFIEHKIVTRRDATPPAQGTVELENGGEGHFVIFKKHPEDTVFIVGQDGENICAISKTRRVVLPLPFYAGDTTDYAERAVQDRLFAILEASTANTETPVPANQIIPFLTERLGKRGLAAVMLNKTSMEALGALTTPTAYVFDAMRDDLVFGIARPEYVGHIVEDTTRHGDEPLMDEENLTPFPAFTRAGILALGGIVGVRIKR